VKGINRFLLAIIGYATAFAALTACGQKRPEAVLTKDQMVQVMSNIYVTEEKVNQLALSRDSAKEVFSAIGQKVFEDAGIRDSVFKKSFDYYMERPKEMELIYTALVDTLQLREQRAPISNGHP
jgi:hypothetical protein